jgi:hypothetical protein
LRQEKWPNRLGHFEETNSKLSSFLKEPLLCPFYIYIDRFARKFQFILKNPHPLSLSLRERDVEERIGVGEAG